jgi:hypothetical protein
MIEACAAAAARKRVEITNASLEVETVLIG